MTFLPIVERELIEAARRRGTYWLRIGAALAGLLVGGWIMLFPVLRTPQMLGITLFIALATVIYIYSLFIGVFRTSDCLSEEKREGTLGLLFLTDLKGYDIVLGKLTASSLNAFYGVLALFPVMAIPLLVGGVTVQEFWRVVLVAINMMFFSMAAGMFASSVSRDERRAMLLAFILVFGLTAGFPLLGAVLESESSTRPYAELCLVPSPGYAAVVAFEMNYKGTGGANYYFQFSVASTHILSWLLLIAASRIVPRTWQDRALDAAAARRRERLHQLEVGTPVQRARLRRRLLELNPIYWLLARRRMKIVAIWALLAVGAGIWIVGLLVDPHDWSDEAAFIWTSVLAHLILKLWVATEASRRFSLDRQSGALELLLSTPMTVKEIVTGQRMGLERQFAGPALVVLLADFVFLMVGQRTTDQVVLWLVWMVILVADLIALGWVGMWRGLNSRRPNRAAAAAMLRVMVLPWGLFVLFMTGLALAPYRWRVELSDTLLIIIWGVIGLAIDIIFAWPARRRLLQEFREVAAQRFDMRWRKG